MRLTLEEQFISHVLSLGLKSRDPHREEGIWSSDGINWDRFIRFVAHHGLGALLFYWTGNLSLEKTLPDGVSRALEDLHRSSVSILENHHKILKRILGRFCENGIEVILLKGAQLAHSDYPEFCLRPIEDIDVLVRRSDRPKVMRLMLEMGFHLYQTNETCDKFFIAGISKRRKETLCKPIFVEIHSDLQTPIRLNRSFRIDIDEFWYSTQEKAVFGFPFLQICPTHNVIYLGAHLSHHHFSRLIWLYDIALVLHQHRTEVDWKMLENTCRSVGIKNSLYYSLSLCQEFFKIAIPEGVLKGLSPSWWRRRIGHFLIRRNLFFPEKPRFSRLSRFLIKIFCIDNWLEAALWFLFPTREWMKRQYSLQGTREIYPYYLLHPILYLINAIRAPLRYFRS